MMKNLFLCLLLLTGILFGTVNICHAQGDVTPPPPPPSAQENDAEKPIFTMVDVAPEFPGGEDAMMKFLMENVHYPKVAIKAGISGKVYVNFIINTDGSITNVNVKRGIGGGCDAEAIRVIKSMPNWKPGLQNGEPVKVSFTMPINFILRDAPPKQPKDKKKEKQKVKEAKSDKGEE